MYSFELMSSIWKFSRAAVFRICCNVCFYALDAELRESIDSLKDVLVSLDISHNQLPDLAIVDVLQDNHGSILRLLRLVGNPMRALVGSYRKVCEFLILPFFPVQRIKRVFLIVICC